MATGSLEREYNAHLSAMAAERQSLVEGHADLHRLQAHDGSVTDFVLKAGPILARAGSGSDTHQALYEELATITNNTAALERISLARRRKDDAVRAASRAPNVRKTGQRVHWINQDMVCSVCSSALILLPREACMVCPTCGQSHEYQDTSSNALPFGERGPTSESSYSRQTHLSELLAQVQGIERTEVPAEVIAAVRKELRKHRLLDKPASITPQHVRHHLKRLRMSKWYDNAMQIALIVSNGKCRRLTLPAELVNDIHAAFQETQDPFDRAIAGSKRKNYLAYHYFVHKRCQINGFEQYAKAFKLLKSRDKVDTPNPNLIPSFSSCDLKA